jgi:hypothetical protein
MNDIRAQIALNYRFEHSIRDDPSPQMNTPLDSTKIEKASIPTNRNSPFGPISFVSTISFLTSFLAAKLYCDTTYNGRPSDIVLVFVTTPAVLLSSVIMAWWRGILAVWWRYEEVYVPLVSAAS